jgi:hypothetical protein
VEAPGIEGLWRKVGFGGSRLSSITKPRKTRRSRDRAQDEKSVSIGLAETDCSNEVRLVSQALVALDAGDLEPARTVLNLVLEAMAGDDVERGRDTSRR